MLKRCLYILSILILGMYPYASLAINGYDHFNHTRVSIVAGDSIGVGENIAIYIWDDRKIVAAEVDNIIKRGQELELEVTIRETGDNIFFEIKADDAGIDSLPHFDPGLPYPEALHPKAHMKHNLLEARGNMVKQGNHLEQGNHLDYDPKLHTKNLIENRSHLLDNEHLLYQGLQPVQ